MENTKKIIIFIIITCFLISCKNEYEFRNESLFLQKEVVELSLITHHIKYNYKYIECNDNNKKKCLVSDVVDIKSLDYIHNFDEDSALINSDYYEVNPFFYYLKDKKNIYIHQYLYGTPRFFVAGSSNDYKMLGGSYIRVGEKIYGSGYELAEVDVTSFSTIKVTRNKSEWEFTLGKDKNHLFSGNVILGKKNALEEYYLDEKLIDEYF